MSEPIKTVMLVAGEPSGDALGGQLIEGLKALAPGKLKLVGVGGAQMRVAGLQSLYSLDDTSVMGLREVVPRIPRILARVGQAARFAVKMKPDMVVLIDSPDFTHRIAKRIRKLAPDITLVNYVAPQVWASRADRAKKMAHYFDHVLCLLPFEEKFFAEVGLKATFVGHPVVERVPPRITLVVDVAMEHGDGLAGRLGGVGDRPEQRCGVAEPHLVRQEPRDLGVGVLAGLQLAEQLEHDAVVEHRRGVRLVGTQHPHR